MRALDWGVGGQPVKEIKVRWGTLYTRIMANRKGNAGFMEACRGK